MLSSCAKANAHLCQQILKFGQADPLFMFFAGCAGTETERSGQTVFTNSAGGIIDKGGKG